MRGKSAVYKMSKSLHRTSGNIVYSVDFSMKVLLEIARTPGARLSDLARSVGLTKTRALRLLRTMIQTGFVQRDQAGGYRLGSAMLVLSAAATMQIDLVKIADPILEKLSAKVNETVQLRIRDHTETICIGKWESTRDLRVHAEVGRRRPLHAGSSKIFLAMMSDQLWEEMLPATLTSMTNNTITDRAALIRELVAIRAAGYCISRGEVRDHLVAVAVPVIGVDGSAVASVNIVAPGMRTNQTDLDHFRVLLFEACQKISLRLQ